jgi:hypothetical protein
MKIIEKIGMIDDCWRIPTLQHNDHSLKESVLKGSCSAL